jgi:hypothetical protein
VKGKLVIGVGSQYFHTTSERGVCSITTADAHTSAASSRRTDDPADLNGLVRSGERRNLVSARVPSGFKRAIHSDDLLSARKGLRYRLQNPPYSCKREVPGLRSSDV